MIATKADTMVAELGEKYILFGPDFNKEGENPEFEEDLNLLRDWRQMVYAEGIRIRIGKWKVAGRPTAILVDFSSMIPTK